MSAKLIQVIFGAHSSRELEEEIRLIYARMPAEDREIMEFLRNRHMNTALLVRAGKSNQFFGQAALKFMHAYSRVAYSAVQGDYMIEPRQSFPMQERPEEDDHLARTRLAPYVQVSDAAPTTGQYYKYAPKKYLPEETHELYARDHLYGLPHRFPVGRVLHLDGRTRIPLGH